MYADLILFNLNELSIEERYMEPSIPLKGIKYVIVNGKVVIEDGRHLGSKRSKVVRRVRYCISGLI